MTVGTQVELKLEAIGEICRGTVVYVSPVRSRETNKFTLRIRLDEPGSNVKAGLFAKGELRLLQKPSTIFYLKMPFWNGMANILSMCWARVIRL